jgi:hypothetical protein
MNDKDKRKRTARLFIAVVLTVEEEKSKKLELVWSFEKSRLRHFIYIYNYF